MFKDGLRRLISNASISSVSVLKPHPYNNVKFDSAGIIHLHVLFILSILLLLYCRLYRLFRTYRFIYAR